MRINVYLENVDAKVLHGLGRLLQEAVQRDEHLFAHVCLLVLYKVLDKLEHCRDGVSSNEPPCRRERRAHLPLQKK